MITSAIPAFLKKNMKDINSILPNRATVHSDDDAAAAAPAAVLNVFFCLPQSLPPPQTCLSKLNLPPPQHTVCVCMWCEVNIRLK